MAKIQDRYIAALKISTDINNQVMAVLDARTGGGYGSVETEADLDRIAEVEMRISREFKQAEATDAYQAAARDLLHWGIVMVAFLPAYNGKTGQDLLALFNRAEKDAIIRDRVIKIILKFRPSPELEFFATLRHQRNTRPHKDRQFPRCLVLKFQYEHDGKREWVRVNFIPETNYLRLDAGPDPKLEDIRLGVSGGNAVLFGEYLLQKEV